MQPLRAFVTAVSLIALAACSASDATSPLADATARQGKSSSLPPANIPVETVPAGTFTDLYRQLDMGVDANGRTYWVEEMATVPDGTGESAGSMVLHVLLVDPLTVRTTVLSVRQRTGWTVVLPSTAVYDNATVKMTFTSPTQTVTMSMLHKPGKTVQDHGVMKKR